MTYRAKKVLYEALKKNWTIAQSNSVPFTLSEQADAKQLLQGAGFHCWGLPSCRSNVQITQPSTAVKL